MYTSYHDFNVTFIILFFDSRYFFRVLINGAGNGCKGVRRQLGSGCGVGGSGYSIGQGCGGSGDDGGSNNS